MGSDGVWEFLKSDWVSKALAKKIATDGAPKSVYKLVKESRKRWRDEEGDYCDDITAMLMMLEER